MSATRIRTTVLTAATAFCVALPQLAATAFAGQPRLQLSRAATKRTAAGTSTVRTKSNQAPAENNGADDVGPYIGGQPRFPGGIPRQETKNEKPFRPKFKFPGFHEKKIQPGITTATLSFKSDASTLVHSYIRADKLDIKYVAAAKLWVPVQMTHQLKQSGGVSHQVTFTGLAPNTVYVVRILDWGGKGLFPNFVKFRTLPAL